MAAALTLMGTALLLAAADTTGLPAPPPLAAPTQLLVELLPQPPTPNILVVDTPRPRFSFVPQDDTVLQRNMTHYRIVVTAACERPEQCPVVWDSGRTSAPTAASILCGAALSPATSFRWTARWWDGNLSSAVAEGAFDSALSADGIDWHGARWLGGGQAQFRLTVPSMPAAAAPWRARLHVASPGGATADVDGEPQGDEIGITLWADVSMPTISRLLVFSRPFSDRLCGCRTGKAFRTSAST